MAWFGRGKQDDEDDDPTGQIPAQVIATAAGEPPPEPVAKPAARSTVAPADRPDDPGLEQLRSERSTLIQLCLYALDRARSGGVVERLEEGLAGVGVTAMRPDGERFDPALHEAGGTVSTSDGKLDGLVAETEVVGFADGGKVLRAPIVTVYACKPGADG